MLNVKGRLEELKETLLSDRIHTENLSVRGIAIDISNLVKIYECYGLNKWLRKEIKNFSMADLSYLIAVT